VSVLDKVGNRQSRTSGLSALSSQSGRTYNARDWLNGDSYDDNGNTTLGLLSGGAANTDVYDFENRLILRIKPDGSSINLSYDADGNRVQKTILNASPQVVSSTTYLVDTNNHTGYAQVLEETKADSAGTTLKTYAYGSDLISRSTSLNGQSSTLSYYLYDGLGSVRALVNEAGSITDSYTYDAFGNLIAQTGTSDNAYRYRGEQWDADLGLYYNRARYLNTDSGRFWNMDSYEGQSSDPMSLHKYLYAHANPLTYEDPSGHIGLQTIQALTISIMLKASLAVPAFGTAAVAVSKINMVAVFTFFRNVQISTVNGAHRLPQLLQAAQRLYPGRVNNHQHHIFPTYIAKALSQVWQQIPKHLQNITTSIPESYHMYLHQQLYKIFPKGDPLKYHKNLQDVVRALEKFYDDFPLR
jgi:RHS repeat-associated protein